jgi:twinkle protein
MDDIARDLIAGMDDHGFCETLIPIMQNGNGTGLTLLYEDWVLARLRLIRHRAKTVFYGTFMTTLRATFPRQVYVQDLFTAMNGTTSQAEVASGDVTPETWDAEIEQVFQHGLPQGVHPGWEGLRPHYRPLKGDLTVITGMPSHLKSSFMHALALNLAKAHGWNFAAFNPEHHPLGSLGGWLAESYMGRRLHQLEPDEHAFVKTWITDHFHMIRPAREVPPTLAWLLSVARLQKERYGLDGLILDPWNLMSHGYSLRDKRETDYIGECLMTLHEFAEYQAMHVWVVAHPTKPQEGRATKGEYAGKFPPVTPYAISGSANWYNMPDFCLCCWRDIEADDDEQKKILEVHVQKNRRYDQCGYPGKALLRYNGRRFFDVGDMTAPHYTERY